MPCLLSAVAIPKSFVLACVFLQGSLHILTRPPAYERAGEKKNFQITGETGKGSQLSYNTDGIDPGYDLDMKPVIHHFKPNASQEQ